MDGCWLFSERGHHMWDTRGRCIFCSMKLNEMRRTCTHAACIPDVPNDATLAKMSASEVRKKYPRYDGYCLACSQHVIVYGSAAHYVAGDW